MAQGRLSPEEIIEAHLEGLTVFGEQELDVIRCLSAWPQTRADILHVYRAYEGAEYRGHNPRAGELIDAVLMLLDIAPHNIANNPLAEGCTLKYDRGNREGELAYRIENKLGLRGELWWMKPEYRQRVA